MHRTGGRYNRTFFSIRTGRGSPGRLSTGSHYPLDWTDESDFAKIGQKYPFKILRRVSR
jgi:hypothetical protein